MAKGWFKIKSWHITHDGLTTLCGKTVVTMFVRNTFPMNERTCETCLRLDERR